jgi:glycosyltransferase involved in cell wall biosynthesis
MTSVAEPRVLRVATSITINTIMRTQLAYLRDAGVDVVCVCDDDQWARGIRELGVGVVPLGMGRRPGLFRAALWGARFVRIVRRERPEIVHMHNAFHGFVGRPLARLAGVPVVVQTIHNWWYLEPPGSLTARLYLRLERFAARFCDAVLFINRDDVRRALDQEIVAPQKIHYVGNGIDAQSLERRLAAVSRGEAREQLGLSEDDFAISMIARLEHPKDHDTLLHAFAAFLRDEPCARLILVGQGLEAARVRALAAQLDVESATRFIGHTPDVSPVLRASDALVLASHCEGFGRALVEGMVASLPVVGSDVAGIRDVIVHGETGLLVRAHDVEALHGALVTLAREPALRTRLGKAGRTTAFRDFDERLAAARVLEVYRSSLARKAMR